MGASEIIYGGRVLIDLTGDTVTPGALLEGYTAHDARGELITGTHRCASAGYYTSAVLGSSRLGMAILCSNTRLGAVALGETKLG